MQDRESELAAITAVKGVCMAEPSFSELLRCEYSLCLASAGVPHCALVDNDEVLGVVVDVAPSAINSCFQSKQVVEEQHVLLTPMLARCSQAGKGLRKALGQMADSCGSVHTTRWGLIGAMAECYSTTLMCSLPFEDSSLFSYSPERARGIGEVVAELDMAGRVLEVGCGYGMSTHALRGCGLEPFAIDNDASLVCEGLQRGGLHPEHTAVLDARWLSCCFELGEFDWVVGLMVGSISPFTQPLWSTVLRESIGMAREGVLFSVKESQEIEFIRELCASAGLEGEVLDRSTGGLYDQWWYVGSLP
ncbi:MAG: class I SAM-dependent methyltransferase [Methermicoccaceae archaeon]